MTFLLDCPGHLLREETKHFPISLFVDLYKSRMLSFFGRTDVRFSIHCIMVVNSGDNLCPIYSFGLLVIFEFRILPDLVGSLII